MGIGGGWPKIADSRGFRFSQPPDQEQRGIPQRIPFSGQSSAPPGGRISRRWPSGENAARERTEILPRGCGKRACLGGDDRDPAAPRGNPLPPRLRRPESSGSGQAAAGRGMEGRLEEWGFDKVI